MLMAVTIVIKRGIVGSKRLREDCVLLMVVVPAAAQRAAKGKYGRREDYYNMTFSWWWYPLQRRGLRKASTEERIVLDP